MPDYILVHTKDEYKIAASLFKEYTEWLNIDLGFQHFESELKDLNDMYSSPDGGILICKKDEQFIACVAVRKNLGKIAELKRMFVKPAYQSQGIGKRLLEEAISLAVKLNYTCIRLDTLNYMTPAINLYKKYGFYEIEAYYYNPNTTTVYFEKKL